MEYILDFTGGSERGASFFAMGITIVPILQRESCVVVVDRIHIYVSGLVTVKELTGTMSNCVN